MRIRLVIIAQLSVEVVGGNVEIWWGAGCFNISCLVLYLLIQNPLHLALLLIRDKANL